MLPYLAVILVVVIGSREAVRKRQFNLAYHPQLCAKTGDIVSGEALIRWNHPREGTRLPESFLGVAEERRDGRSGKCRSR